MWREWNPNPIQVDGVGDCAIRAIACALRLTWEQAYAILAETGFLMGDLPNSDRVWGAVLRQHGFKRALVPDTCPDCYTVADFCSEHPQGTFVVKSNRHVACVIDGVLHDAWNSERCVPIYYWYRDE